MLRSVILSGVNFSIPGEGGDHCVEYLSREQRVGESLVFSVISLALLCRTWVSLPTLDNNNNVSKTESSHSWLLRSLVAVFSMELCYKIISGQLIWCLNPCHVITLLQIYLILAPPSSSPAHYLYRLHIYWLTGQYYFICKCKIFLIMH